MSDPALRTAVVKLRTPQGHEATLEISAPAVEVRLVHMLPLFRQTADALAGLGVQLVEAEGRTVTCRAGCGACCRQLVPIAPVEAQALRALVESMPEPGRSAVRARFADARRRLEEAGMAARLTAARGCTIEEMSALSDDYIRLGVPCPFLENESCSIYTDRPTVCREYLVTSPAANCTAPTAESVAVVPVWPKVSGGLFRFYRCGQDGAPPWLPLTSALNAPAEEPQGAGVRPGTHWMNELLNFISGKDGPPPSLPGMQSG
jgi:Fe-S-cluster containining protein